MKTAIIDLGTNTFNLLIVEGSTTLFKTKIAVKLGEGGITKGYIAEAPFQRGFEALKNTYKPLKIPSRPHFGFCHFSYSFRK